MLLYIYNIAVLYIYNIAVCYYIYIYIAVCFLLFLNALIHNEIVNFSAPPLSVLQYILTSCSMKYGYTYNYNF